MKNIKSTGKRYGIIVAIAVFLAAVAGGMIYLNYPANRLARQLSLGHQYLEEQKYKKAEKAYENATAIDDGCIEGYVGLIEVYEETGKTGKLENCYEDVLDIMEDLEEDQLADARDYVVWIYGKAEEIYGTEDGYYIKVLEKGYNVTEKDKYIREMLSDAYLEAAQTALLKNNREKALEWYDSALALGERQQEINQKKMYIQYAEAVERYESWFQIAKEKGPDWVDCNDTYITENVNFIFMREAAMFYGDIEHIRFMLYDINTDSIPELFIVIDNEIDSCNAYQAYTFADGEMKEIGLQNFYKAGSCILCENGVIVDAELSSAFIEEFKFYNLKSNGEVELIDLIGSDGDGEERYFYRGEKKNVISEEEFDQYFDLLYQEKEGFLYTEANEENIALLQQGQIIWNDRLTKR